TGTSSHGDVLLAVDVVGNRKRVDRVIGTDLPQDVAGRFIERLEVAIELASEHQAATGRKHRAGLRRASAGRPDRRTVGKPDRIDTSEIAVAVGNRSSLELRTAATGISLTGIERLRRSVGAIF